MNTREHEEIKRIQERLARLKRKQEHTVGMNRSSAQVTANEAGIFIDTVSDPVEDYEYTEKSFFVNSGDPFTFYTDGIPEARECLKNMKVSGQMGWAA